MSDTGRRTGRDRHNEEDRQRVLVSQRKTESNSQSREDRERVLATQRRHTGVKVILWMTRQIVIVRLRNTDKE